MLSTLMTTVYHAQGTRQVSCFKGRDMADKHSFTRPGCISQYQELVREKSMSAYSCIYLVANLITVKFVTSLLYRSAKLEAMWKSLLDLVCMVIILVHNQTHSSDGECLLKVSNAQRRLVVILVHSYHVCVRI